MPRQSEETEPRPGMWFFSTLITLELPILDGSASSRSDGPALLHIEIKRCPAVFFVDRLLKRWYFSKSLKWFLLLSIVHLIFVERNIIFDGLSSMSHSTCKKALLVHVFALLGLSWPRTPEALTNVAARFLQPSFLAPLEITPWGSSLGSSITILQRVLVPTTRRRAHGASPPRACNASQ